MGPIHLSVSSKLHELLNTATGLFWDIEHLVKEKWEILGDKNAALYKNLNDEVCLELKYVFIYTCVSSCIYVYIYMCI